MNRINNIHGFTIDQIRPVAEIKAEAWQLTHDKTGAKVLWLKRDDENKTFAIGFQTIPSDDTGVFHILEHSVLNGSDKYPLKEPFVDLIKGSLNTFLNAMTWPDKTMYPVSSRNEQDFINLMRVYLDAVFSPLCISRENIFRQEGWHYELKDINDDPSIKGVVYNEMKGAYSSPERLASQTMMQQLFPDTSYGYSSGGDPDFIPTLTYEKFVENYHNFYNATNATIILDGAMDIEKILAIIDEEYLSHKEYTPRETYLEKQKPVVKDLRTVEFDATSTQDKTVIDYGYVVGDFDDYEKNAAFSVISSVLTDENQSVLKKAVLESGLAQDISMSIDNETYQPYVEIFVNNTNPENEPKLTALVRETLEKAVREGLDKEEMMAVLNRMEFKARERDFGSLPKGIIFAMQAAVWMYGGDPLDGIAVSELYKSLKQKVGTSYYEELIDTYILHSHHCATVMAVPSVGLEGRSQQKLAEKMKQYKASLSAEELNNLYEWNRQFEQWQQSTDTPEIKATLPKLDVSDISEEPMKLEYRVSEEDGVKIIEYDNSTEGIQYYTLHFDLKDLTLEELQDANLLTMLLSHLNTKMHDVATINRLSRNYLGTLRFAVVPFNDYYSDDYQLKLSVSFSCLKENAEEAWKLVREIIGHTSFADRQDILDLVRQNKNDMEMAFVYAGNGFGMIRAMSGCDEASTCREYLAGYEFFRYLKEASENLSDQLLSRLEKLFGRLFSRDRLTVSLMSEGDHQLLQQILKDLPESGEELKKADRPLLEVRKEGIEVASQVSYGCQAVRMKENLADITGKMMVIRNVLSLDYLWTTIRAIGGAYGSGFATRGNNLAYYSYRDPNPANSLDAYNRCGQYLTRFWQSADSLQNYIIGTIGDSEPLLTNLTTMATGDGVYFSNITYQTRKENRRQILTMTKKDIEELIPLFDFAKEEVGVCVVGGKEALEKCGERIDDILKLG